MAERAENTQSSKVKFHVFPDDRFVDFSMYQFGWEKCEPQHSYGPAVRNHYLFHYVIAGKGTLEAENTAGQTQYYSIGAGHGFLICPKQITHYHADLEDPWEYAWIEFDGLRVKEALDLAGLSVNKPVYQPVTQKASKALEELMLQIVDHGEASTLYLTGYGFLFLDQLVTSSAERREKSNSRIRDFYLHEAMHFIEQHYAENISVEDIAAFCGLNRSYFGKVFRDVIGKSPQEFLQNYRITKACQLLKSTRMPIMEVGAAVGYSDQLHFSRAFRRVMEISPRDWRKQHFSM